MSQPWSRAKVASTAPDDQVRRAGEKLAVPAPWRDVGTADGLLWGRCQGSGSTPYQVSVDTTTGASKCTCPSRKFPCKHAVALLFLWSGGHVTEAGMAADFAAEWAAKRESRSSSSTKQDDQLTPEQAAERAERAANRAAQREGRIDAGVDEFERWLDDQLRLGLASGAQQRGPELRRLATRMIDAQAPGLADLLTQASRVGSSGSRWAATVLDRLGSAHLLARAWQRRAELPDDLAETVRTHIGISRRTEDILELPAITDTWQVLGMCDAQTDQVSVRRVWLFGRTSRRFAAVLFFAAGGASPSANLYPGTEVRSPLHFYPGRGNLRASLGQAAEPATPLETVDVEGTPIGELAAIWRQALADDPWRDEVPVAVTGRIAITECDRGSALQAWLVDDNHRIRLQLPTATLRGLLLASGGGQTTLCGELSEDGLRPFAQVQGGRLVELLAEVTP